MEDVLSDAEINELAKLFPPGTATSIRLGRAGFNPALLPPVASCASALDYWLMINDSIAGGVVADGRHRVLTMARASYGFNSVLFGTPPPDVWGVLFLGASAGVPPDLRTDREYRAVIDAGAHLRVSYYPAPW